MLLDTFFTNKIPSSSFTWTDELILVASIFNEFNETIYDRDLLIERFEAISRRLPNQRDSSDYRDEYGAYANFLGITHLEKQDNYWIWKMNPIAQKLLCDTEPNPELFIRLQLALFQYPNPIGAKYHENGNISIEPLSLNKRIYQIKNNIKTVPLRLILTVLINLDEKYGNESSFLTYSEIWNKLFSNPNAVCTFEPDGEYLAKKIIDFRINDENSYYDSNALRNLHILQHTGLITRKSGIIYLNQGNKHISKIISEMKNHFDIPEYQDDRIIKEWSINVLESGEWSKYYMGNTLSQEYLESIITGISEETIYSTIKPLPIINITESRVQYNESKQIDYQQTIILREKSNLSHRNILKIISDKLLVYGLEPKFNNFIDLCCLYPNKLLFEIKSCRLDNIIEQIRKGISQLYEYRYRHQELDKANLILVLEMKPSGDFLWLIKYLVIDRNINLCWLEGDDNLACPDMCKDVIGFLCNRIDNDY
ncbi:hypothetical protein [Herpetosiphon llansteffanensis]|uniref:hypothetical protein n=1 Tax=Herpetosiphon llansteffanensis TaxID=2094568 RepID=UPI000D7C8577|nr:hypothetical protein [Herpetosiphon llansteffanensis]